VENNPHKIFVNEEDFFNRGADTIRGTQAG
jgi:hypothetical protein